MKTLITISKLASEHLLKLLRTNNTNNVLFAVEGGGCNGMRYLLEPVKSVKQLERTDQITFTKDQYNEYHINVCHKSQLYLIGTRIDWTNDFMGQHFSFSNPNEASSCGCGSTFSI